MVTGSSGQLGTEIANVKNLLNLSNISLFNKEKLDVSSAESVDNFFKTNRFDVVINCAAYTNVDQAEIDYANAEKINADSIGYICNSLERYNPDTTLIHISTDYIFDGNFSEPIKEEEIPNPISKYGHSKLLGEKILQKSSIPSIIIRVSWLYSMSGKNFLKTIINLSKKNDSINVIHDQIGSPTSASDLAKAIIKIIYSNKFNVYASKKGVFNFCNLDSCSWFEFAREILYLISSNCKVYPITSEEYKAKAKRPRYSVLNTSKIIKSFGLEISSWKDALQNTINSSNSNYNN